jgi:hypothetical protein
MPHRKLEAHARLRSFLRHLAKKYFYGFRAGEDEKIAIFEKPGSPILIYFEDVGEKGVFVYASVRTTSWEFEGERTDLHDSLSVGLASFLRIVKPRVSSFLWDVFNPAGVEVPPSELYARYLTFAQPYGSTYGLDARGRAEVERLVLGIRSYAAMLPRMTAWSPELAKDPKAKLYEFDCPELKRWAKTVRKALNQPKAELTEIVLRRNPHWMYFRRIKPAVSVFLNPRLVVGLRAVLACEEVWETVTTPRGEFFASGLTENVLTRTTRKRALGMLKQLPGEGNLDRVIFIPLENYCVVLGQGHLICYQADCGRQQFRRLREQMRVQHEREAAVLFRQSRVTLNPRIDDEAFEGMITLLLQREPNVQWVRKMGHSRQPEGGKDIVVEWDMPPRGMNRISSHLAPRIFRKVLVQCKASKHAVGKADVRDIRDLLEHNDATGFLLVASSYLTVGLIEQLLKLRDRGVYQTDWWTRTEIEARLERNLDIAHRFSSLVTIE